jgi:phage FluMu protein Com
MARLEIACPKCGALDQVRMVCMEPTDYALYVDDGRITVGHADDTPMELIEKAGWKDKYDTVYYCDHCKELLLREDLQIVEVDAEGAVIKTLGPEAPVDHYEVVEKVVRLLVAAGIEAHHEWPNHIMFEHGGFHFHWGTVNMEWDADIEDIERTHEVGNAGTEIPSNSTDPYAIFSGIYLETTKFLERQ